MKNSHITRLFMVTPEFEEEYNRRISLGAEHIKNSRINIVGICRNVENKINNFLEFCSYAQTASKQVNIFLYENDSTDDTVNILEKTKQYFNNFNYTSDTLNRPLYGQTKEIERTTNLAEYRNRCVDFVKNHFEATDYTIVIDVDFEEFSFDGLLNTFSWFLTNDVDGICGNSFEYKNVLWQYKTLWNYDSWAYRENYWEDQSKYADKNNPNPLLWFGLQIPVIGSPIKYINSGFGGCCVYKTSYYIKGTYSGEDCEHVVFHKLLKENYGFKLAINPSQIILMNK